MINKKTFTFLAISLFVILSLANFAVAFGIASSGDSFTISPGETKTTSLRLQNMVGEEDINAVANITKGYEIADIIGKEKYLVKLGTKDTEIPIRVHIPADAKIGSTYSITISIKTVASGDSQGVAFGTGVDQTITALVVSETETPLNLTPIILSIIGVLIIGIVIFLIKRKKKKK